ncbi:hypothetical protein BGW80DRAFT_1523344 [Lactifluus volemus]|nr:hypothetical protein BGW80DRAFT_1523344 [Lactifluus volemus]
MTGANTHGYNLRSKDKTKVEHYDQVIFMPVFESSDESESFVVPSIPRPLPSTRHPGRKNIEMDPSEHADAAAELRAPHPKNPIPPSAPDIPRPGNGMEGSQSWGLQGGSTASSDAGGENRSRKIRSRQDTYADVEAARLTVELQRHRDARRILREQKVKRLRMEAWALVQRAEHFNRQADEEDKLIKRKKEGAIDDDSESELSESEPSVMECDNDDEEERASQLSESYAPTEVYSESEQQTWALMYQPQQGVTLQR